MKARYVITVVLLIGLGYSGAVMLRCDKAVDPADGTTLLDYSLNNDQRQMTKWQGYLEVYERHFSRFRNTEVNVLEIGVQHGGSLQMWKSYFGRKANIFGVDIDPPCKTVEEPQIKVFIGDQADRAFLNKLRQEIPKLDIVIDDGGHKMHQQKTSFEELYPHLSDNGVYVVEDLHTSYWPEYDGSYRHDGTFIEMAKSLVDDLNAWKSKNPAHQVTDMTRSLYGLHFYNSIAVFEKRKVSPDKLLRTGKIWLQNRVGR